MLGDDLEWFTTLAELERVGAAAERLHIAQPTLSRMLGRLERRLGVELFDRNGKRIALNDFGRIYYEHARRARAELDAAAHAIADLANPAKGVVRLSFLHSFGGWLVPQLVGGFRRGSGRITVTLRQAAAEVVTAQVLDGKPISASSPRGRPRRASAGAACCINRWCWPYLPTTGWPGGGRSGSPPSPTRNSSRCIPASVCAGSSTKCAPRPISVLASHSNRAISSPSRVWWRRASVSRWFRSKIRPRCQEW